MHLAGRGEEHAVARHRVVHARAGQHHCADARRERHDAEDGEHVAGHETEEPLGHGVHQPAVERAQLGRRERKEKQQVQGQVEDDHGDRAQAERQGDVAAGVAHLLGDVRRGVPSRVAEHDRHEREQPARRGDGGPRRQGRHRSPSNREAGGDEEQQRRNLQPGEHVLDEAARPEAPHVDPRQRGDGGQRDDRPG